MKKTQVTNKETPQKTPSTSEATSGKMGELLSKLEPQQIVELTNNVAKLFDSAAKVLDSTANYASEREKTNRTAIEATAKIRGIDADLEKGYLNHEQEMERIQKEVRDGEHQFLIDMKNLEITSAELEKKDRSIHRVLDLLEAGKISEKKLVDFINSVKQ